MIPTERACWWGEGGCWRSSCLFYFTQTWTSKRLSRHKPRQESVVQWHSNPHLSDIHTLSYYRFHFLLIDVYWKPPVCNVIAWSQTPLWGVEWKKKKRKRAEVLDVLLSNSVTLSKSPITSTPLMFDSVIALRSCSGEVLGCVPHVDSKK